MKHELQTYALIAEIVGAVAVVISLIYVGVGVRQNTDAIMVANHQALVAMDMEKNAWFKDPQFAAAYEAALTEGAQLTPAQQRQINTFSADTFNAWEFAFITRNNHMMDEEIWRGWDGFYRSELRRRPHQQFWSSARNNFSPAFSTYVEGILSGE